MGRSEKIDLDAIPVQILRGDEKSEKFDPVVQLYIRALHELGYGRNRRKNRRRMWVEPAPPEKNEVKHDAS